MINRRLKQLFVAALNYNIIVFLFISYYHPSFFLLSVPWGVKPFPAGFHLEAGPSLNRSLVHHRVITDAQRFTPTSATSLVSQSSLKTAVWSAKGGHCAHRQKSYKKGNQLAQTESLLAARLPVTASNKGNNSESWVSNCFQLKFSFGCRNCEMQLEMSASAGPTGVQNVASLILHDCPFSAIHTSRSLIWMVICAKQRLKAFWGKNK